MIDPDEGICAIGSRRQLRAGRGRALLDNTELSAREIAEKAMKIAGEICIYTNDQMTIEELKARVNSREPPFCESRIICDDSRIQQSLEYRNMAIFLPGTAEDQALALDEMTPREIVAELDKYVVGQQAAKRAVAIALRNRMRRQKLPPELADEIMPKNIIMIGPTGVGKTEIARRLAKLTNSPFLKVEASKFTEVGYVGRDVESIVRDLVEIAIDMVREEKMEEVEDKAELAAEDRLLDLLLPPTPAATTALRQRHEVPGTQCDSAAGGDSPDEREHLTTRSPASASSAPARSCGSSSARASWTSAWSSWMCATATSRASRSSPTRAPKRWTSTSRTCCRGSSASARRSAR